VNGYSHSGFVRAEERNGHWTADCVDLGPLELLDPRLGVLWCKANRILCCESNKLIKYEIKFHIFFMIGVNCPIDI
jgi:hypothetical protein